MQYSWAVFLGPATPQLEPERSQRFVPWLVGSLKLNCERNRIFCGNVMSWKSVTASQTLSCKNHELERNLVESDTRARSAANEVDGIRRKGSLEKTDKP